MKQRIFLLSLSALLLLSLCACQETEPKEETNEPQETTSAETGWTQVEEPLNLTDYAAGEDRKIIPEDWSLPAGTVRDFTRIEVKGDLLLYGDYQETVMPYGFTVSRYADGTLTPVYTFDEGDVMTYQQFFSPDGSKLGFLWASVLPAKQENWKVRLVDTTTWQEEDIALPPREGAPTFLAVMWVDDNTLKLGSGGEDADGNMVPMVWTYSLTA
ncbi:MAG: hypothetical protein MR910_05125 [Clostridiales bacterium]|nr:hypothetical protein [Clostridiales bacterium]